MVSSGNALVGGETHWLVLESAEQPLTLAGHRLLARSTRLRTRAASSAPDLRVWQWYWVAGHLTASDYLAKAYTAWAMLSGQGDDTAVIVVHAPITEKKGDGGNGGNSGGDALEAFVAAAWPQIENALQRTRERR